MYIRCVKMYFKMHDGHVIYQKVLKYKLSNVENIKKKKKILKVRKVIKEKEKKPSLSVQADYAI